MSGKVILVFSTCPDEAAAERIGTLLVQTGLAACVNVLPAIRSIYKWQGAVERASEVLLLIKSAEERFAELSQRIRELHPYELPEIVAVPVCGGLPEYLDWVIGNSQAVNGSK